MHFNHTDLNSGQLLAIGMLQRLRHVSVNLKYTLKNILEEPQLEFSSGLSVRAVLLDTLIILDLLLVLAEAEDKNSKDELKNISENLCNNILSDGFNSTLDYFEIANLYGYSDEVKTKSIYNSFVEKYSTF